jgi:hypothetical protein
MPAPTHQLHRSQRVSAFYFILSLFFKDETQALNEAEQARSADACAN